MRHGQNKPAVKPQSRKPSEQPQPQKPAERPQLQSPELEQGPEPDIPKPSKHSMYGSALSTHCCVSISWGTEPGNPSSPPFLEPLRSVDAISESAGLCGAYRLVLQYSQRLYLQPGGMIIIWFPKSHSFHQEKPGSHIAQFFYARAIRIHGFQLERRYSTIHW